MTEFVENFPDCLVFKIEEIDKDTNEIDTTLYILYDKHNHTYLLRGQRKWSPKFQACTYSFECEFAHELFDFISYIICPSNRVNETLFNYDNLPDNSIEITFEFLHGYDHRDYEIAGYDNRKLKRKYLIKNLRMLRNVFNYY